MILKVDLTIAEAKHVITAISFFLENVNGSEPNGDWARIYAPVIAAVSRVRRRLREAIP